MALAGLVVVVPIALFLTVSGGDLESTFRVLNPISTYALPVVVMVSFWWEDWPGATFGRGAAVWIDLGVIAGGAVLLTLAGQLVGTGHVDARGVFEANAGLAHLPTFPGTMPLGGGCFVAMLEVTLVGEGWPLRRLGRISGGLAALVIAWAVALVLRLTLVDFQPPGGSPYHRLAGPLAANHYAAVLLCVGAWQALFFVAARGAPFADISGRALRLLTAHASVVGGGVATYVVAAHALGVDADAVAAAGASMIAACVLWGLLAEGWPFRDRERHASLLAVAVTAPLAVVIDAALSWIGHQEHWLVGSPSAWASYAAANALAGGVIVHVAVGRRWPFNASDDQSGPSLSAALDKG